MQNTLNWFEIPVADLDRAMRFYGALTGQALKRESIGAPGEEMAVFANDDPAAATGALLKSANRQPGQQGTMVYLNAEPSIDAWLSRASQAGGQVIVPKTALPPGMGYFAHVLDTEGNHVGLHALN